MIGYRTIERIMSSDRQISCVVWLAFFLSSAGALAEEADLVLHHGRIVTVDRQFSIHEAMAIKGGRILQVGSSTDVLKLKGVQTELLDLGGKMVLPGLIDSHTHPGSAAMTEFDHVIPEMESIPDVLNYIKARAAVLTDGEWIEVRQVFITRLREQRYPTRAELDRAAPNHPVVFSTGPDASLNSRALQLCGIDKNFRIPDGVPGRIEKDAQGEPTGILRTYANYVKGVKSSGKKPREEDHLDRLRQLFHDYNSVGLTSVADRSADTANIERYQKLLASGELTVRMSVSYHVATAGPIEEIQQRIREVARHPLCKGDSMLRIIGIKTFLDGGMLTGSAYMREPWGVSDVYAITDPDYRGVLFIPKERLLPIVRTAVESGLQFTAHSVGDGAVHTLLEVYEEINRTKPIQSTRPCITHCNFMSREAVEKAASLGVVIDMQPAWLYLDTRTLVKQFGYDRLRYFQPLQSIFKAGGIAGGGSDHMQKVGSLRSINPYNPFLAMWTTITRKARWFDGVLHPEEALTREQAIRFYTANNAWLLFQEGEIGSLETGKLADFIVVDRDLLNCPVDDIRSTQVLRTYLNGKLVFRRE
jgi:predicted amidohydrolase YtcJ